MRKLLVLLSMVILSGCAGTMPYSSEFSCPQMETGVCGSAESVYDSAVSESDSSLGRKSIGYQTLHQETAPGGNLDEKMAKAAHTLTSDLLACMKHRVGQAKCISDAKVKFEHTMAVLEAERGKRQAERSTVKLKEEVRRHLVTSLAPSRVSTGKYLRTSPKIVRVMFLPYRTKDDFLAGTRYNWMVVDFGKWIVVP